MNSLLRHSPVKGYPLNQGMGMSTFCVRRGLAIRSVLPMFLSWHRDGNTTGPCPTGSSGNSSRTRVPAPAIRLGCAGAVASGSKPWRTTPPKRSAASSPGPSGRSPDPATGPVGAPAHHPNPHLPAPSGPPRGAAGAASCGTVVKGISLCRYMLDAGSPVVRVVPFRAGFIRTRSGLSDKPNARGGAITEREAGSGNTP